MLGLTRRSAFDFKDMCPFVRVSSNDVRPVVSRMSTETHTPLSEPVPALPGDLALAFRLLFANTHLHRIQINCDFPTVARREPMHHKLPFDLDLIHSQIPRLHWLARERTS